MTLVFVEGGLQHSLDWFDRVGTVCRGLRSVSPGDHRTHNSDTSIKVDLLLVQVG